MSDEEFKERLLEILQTFSLSVSTEIEYGYDYGDTAYVRVKLKDDQDNVIMEDFGTINLPQDRA